MKVQIANLPQLKTTLLQDSPNNIDIESGQNIPLSLSTSVTQSNLPKGILSLEMNEDLWKSTKCVYSAVAGLIPFTVICFIDQTPFAVKVLSQSLFAGSYIYLTGLTYTMVNDIIGCYRCLPYFSLGHTPSQQSLIKSNDPITMGIAWGVLAGNSLSLVAGGLYSAATLTTGFLKYPFTAPILPYFTFSTAAVLAGAHLYSLKKESDYKTQFFFDLGNNDYQESLLRRWKISRNPEESAKWLANSSRNLVGYIALPLLAIAGLALICTASVYSPSFLFESAKVDSIFPLPLVVAGLLAVWTSSACFYLNANHEKVDETKPFALQFS